MRNKQTVINAVVRRDTRVEIKQKTRAKRGFPSHKSSPKRKRKTKCKRKRKQESITHSVDFFYCYYFCIFLRTRNSIATHPPKCCDRERDSEQSCYIKQTKRERNNRNKPNLLCVAHDLRGVTQNVVPFLFFRARVLHRSNNTQNRKQEEKRRDENLMMSNSLDERFVQTVVCDHRKH